MAQRIDLPGARPQKRRSAWRQRLVEAERGMSQGVRRDSTFFVHFFGGSFVIAAGWVLGIGLAGWTVIILAVTLVLSAEMFNQVLKAIWRTVGHHLDEEGEKAVRMGTAAVFVALAGAILAIGLIFGYRLCEMFAGGA